MRKQEFLNNKIVEVNLSELYSCMKVVYGKDMDGYVLQEWLWKNRKESWIKPMLESYLSMPKIARVGEILNKDFDRFFKIVLR